LKQKKLLYKISFLIFISLIVANPIVCATSMQANTDDRSTFENITAKSCILMDADSGVILYNKSAHEKAFPASTTKLVTALLTLERCNLNDKAQVSYYATKSVPATYSISDLKPGEIFTIKDLLYTLMVGSSNDSAFVLAQYIASGGNNYPIDNSQNAKTAFTN